MTYTTDQIVAALGLAQTVLYQTSAGIGYAATKQKLVNAATILRSLAESYPKLVEELAALRAQGEPRCTDCTDAQQCAAYERGVVAGRRAPRAVPEGYALVPELTDEQIVEIRDDHLPSQGDSFDCIAFARALLAAAKEGSNG